MKWAVTGLSIGAALLALPAVAQEAPMATAGSAVALPEAAPQSQPLQIEPTADEDQQPQPEARKIHGMVEVGIGTGGYREAAVAIDAPLPNGGELMLWVQTAQAAAPRAPKRLAPTTPD